LLGVTRQTTKKYRPHQSYQCDSQLLFFRSGCGPCKAIAPTFEALARSNPNAVFVKVDVDQNQAVAQKYGVRAMPTFLFMRKGSILDTLRGANSSKLTSLTAQYIKGGVGSSGSFPGGGQTIAGGSGARLGGGGGGGGGAQPAEGLLGMIGQIPKENLMPFVIVLCYLAYVVFGNK
jgi:thioredoxin 1